ncbi:MAG: outer membrane protein [Planctomycetota bacterium]
MRASPTARAGRSLAAAALLASLFGAGCYLPPPPEQYARPGGAADWQGGFGRASIGAVVHADFFGKVDGLDPGTGFSIDLPPFAPVALALTCIDIAAALEGVDVGLSYAVGPEVWQSGVSDPTRYVVSDFSMDFSFSLTTHDDEASGGKLDYTSLMVGVRLAGPRRYVPRYYLTGGWGWYDFDFDSRPDADVHGPYAGAGLEIMPSRNLSVALDFKAHFYFGDDDAGVAMDGGARQVAVTMGLYW